MGTLANYFGKLIGLQRRPSNFPQNHVTDHRVKKSWGNLESILDGNLSPILNAFRAKS